MNQGFEFLFGKPAALVKGIIYKIKTTNQSILIPFSEKDNNPLMS